LAQSKLTKTIALPATLSMCVCVERPQFTIYHLTFECDCFASMVTREVG